MRFGQGMRASLSGLVNLSGLVSLSGLVNPLCLADQALLGLTPFSPTSDGWPMP